MLSAGWHSLNWGDVPTWVGSVLTGVALLIAAITYRKSIRESAREQAKSITVWVGEQAADLSYELQIKNGSNSAIYSAAVYYSRQVLVAPTYNSPYYLAEHNAGGLIRIGRWASIGPGESRTATFERTLSDPAIPWLYFRDADGIDWIRDYRARLTRHNYWLMRYISESYYMNQTTARKWFRYALLIYGFMFMFYGIREWAFNKTHRTKPGERSDREEPPANADQPPMPPEDGPAPNDG